MAVTIGGSGNQTIRTTGLVYGDALGTLDSGIAGFDVIKVLSGENTAYGDAGALTGTLRTMRKAATTRSGARRGGISSSVTLPSS